MNNYLSACEIAIRGSKEGGVWAIVFDKKVGYLAYRKHQEEIMPEELIHFKNGFESWRRK